jgi:hypothetical protein
MSFSDMMSSGRGPGVIGMLMALVVLIGFGVLFMFATDEGMQGGDQSIESVIRNQAREIEHTQGGIDNGQKSLDGAPERLKNAKEFSRLSRGNESLRGRIQTLGDDIKASKADLAGRIDAFEAYKDEFRAYVRGKAKGESIGVLETKTGAVYKNVNIREVTAVGIQIRHDEGQKRIPFEELPVAMIERFQFDAKQKAAAVEKEQAAWSEHEAAVTAADVVSEGQAAERVAKEAEALRQKNTRLMAAKQARIAPLTEEIKFLQEALLKESEKRFSRAPQMRAQLANKQGELATLRAEVARMSVNP